MSPVYWPVLIWWPRQRPIVHCGRRRVVRRSWAAESECLMGFDVGLFEVLAPRSHLFTYLRVLIFFVFNYLCVTHSWEGFGVFLGHVNWLWRSCLLGLLGCRKVITETELFRQEIMMDDTWRGLSGRNTKLLFFLLLFYEEKGQNPVHFTQ